MVMPSPLTLNANVAQSHQVPITIGCSNGVVPDFKCGEISEYLLWSIETESSVGINASELDNVDAKIACLKMSPVTLLCLIHTIRFITGRCGFV